MIQITIYENDQNEFKGFDCIGHAEYDDVGKDIVCAGVSALVFTALNAISEFTSDQTEEQLSEETGLISLRFQDVASHDSELLMKSLILGLQGIQDTYGDEYISLIFKEV